jgi:hypothetical protein
MIVLDTGQVLSPAATQSQFLRASSGAEIAYQNLGLICIKNRRLLVLQVCGEGLLHSDVSYFNASPVL